jgi:hypothetical protein
MKTIGFIDYYLDEWHAQQYPAWLAEASGGAMKVAYAYGMQDADNGLSNADFCAQRDIQLLPSIEEVVERSDCLIVLSPDNPEFHEQLAMLPLRSGKPTYIDKTFAPDRRTAKLLFETADTHGTPMYSSSALRFAAEYRALSMQGIDSICSIGPGTYDNYAVHQVEPIVALMGAEAERVMFTGTQHSPSLLIGFSGGRQASIQHFGWECPFGLTLQYDSGNAALAKPESDFFRPFVQELVAFFENGEAPVDPDETIAIATILEYGRIAKQNPYQWVNLPQN